MCEVDCNKVLDSWYNTINSVSKTDLETFVQTHQMSSLYDAERQFHETYFAGEINADVEVFGVFGGGGGGSKQQRDTYMKNTTVQQLNLLDSTGHLTTSAYNSFYSKTASPVSLQAYIKCMELSNPSSVKARIAGDLEVKGNLSVFVNYYKQNQWEPDVLTIQVLNSAGLVLISAEPDHNNKHEYSVKNGQGIVLNYQRIASQQQTVTINPEKMESKTLEITEVFAKPGNEASNDIVSVDSRNSLWQNSGVAVLKGQTVEIKVIRNMWTVAHQGLAENPFVTGSGYQDRPAGMPPHYNGPVYIGQLVGKRGATMFPIGNSKVYTAEENHTLELAMFDNAGPGTPNDVGYADNYGSLDVEITVYGVVPVLAPVGGGAAGAVSSVHYF